MEDKLVRGGGISVKDEAEELGSTENKKCLWQGSTALEIMESCKQRNNITRFQV